MNVMRLDRRSWLGVMAATASGAWTGWQWAGLQEFDLPSLQGLARKVLGSISPELAQSCLKRLQEQFLGDQHQAPLTSMAPVLHDDDVAHERVVDVQGVRFSYTQIGLLALLNQSEAA